MSNYIVAKIVTDDGELREKLRNSISAWAGEFREEYADFGQNIQIDKISYMPTHAAAFQGYYEHRRAELAERPLSGDDRVQGQPTITSPGGVNPWDYEMDGLPDSWDDRRSSIILSDSKHIEKCHNCGGHGNNRCYDCKGEGVKECKTCHGKGTVHCTHCHGKGKLTCKVCSGYKYTESRDMYGTIVRSSCSSCGGTGEKQCHICLGKGTWTCEDCGGKKSVQCAACRGEGTLVCNTCKGQGKMLKYIRVVQKFLPHTIIRSYNHSEVDRCFPEFEFDPSTPGDVLDEIEAERLQDGYLDGVFDPEGLKLKDFLQDLEDTRRRLEAECPEGTLGSSTESRRQKFMLIQVDTYFIEYRHKGKEFSLLAWGPEGKNIHAENSPFHHERYDYFSRGRELFDNKKYGEAMTCFEEALKVNEDEEVKQTLEETIQWIIGVLPKQYLKGIRLGGFLGIALFSLFLFLMPGGLALVTPEKIMALFQEANFPGGYISGVLVVLTALLTLILARRRRKTFQNPNRKIIRSDKRRFVIGLLNGLGIAVISAAVVMGLNYYGIPSLILQLIAVAEELVASLIGG